VIKRKEEGFFEVGEPLYIKTNYLLSEDILKNFNNTFLSEKYV
jgi:hypothetical protein